MYVDRPAGYGGTRSKPPIEPGALFAAGARIESIEETTQ